MREAVRWPLQQLYRGCRIPPIPVTACPGTPSLGSPTIAEGKMAWLEYLGSLATGGYLGSTLLITRPKVHAFHLWSCIFAVKSLLLQSLEISVCCGHAETVAKQPNPTQCIVVQIPFLFPCFRKQSSNLLILLMLSERNYPSICRGLFRLEIRKYSSLKGSTTRTDCPRKWSSHHP